MLIGDKSLRDYFCLPPLNSKSQEQELQMHNCTSAIYKTH